MVRRLKEDNFDLIKAGKKDKKTLDAYTAEIKNLKKELSDCKNTKRKMFLQSTIAQYEKKAKEIEKFLKNTESLRRTRRTSMKESYSDINNVNVWEVFDYVKELLTPDGLVENMARWMGLDDLTKCMQYICRTQGINVLEDEEFEESTKRSKPANLKEQYKDYSDDYEGYHEFGYEEPDGGFYSDVLSNFTVEEYYNDETDDVMGWTWSCSDDFAPTREYFESAEDAFMDAVNVLSPDDGSVLVIDGDFDSYGYNEYGYDDYDEDEDNDDEFE